MPTKVIMPQMGESIFEGTITKWLKKVGERISRDEPLFEISTDKVDSEIPSPASGIVKEILFPEGKTVQINTVVAVIGGEGEAGAPEPAKPGPIETAPAMEKPRDVATEPKPAPPPVPEEKPLVPASENKPVATPSKPLAETAAETRPPAPMASPPPAPAHDIRTSPLVRRLARENNIDLSKIRGSGLEGRITKQDILGFLQQHGEGFEAAAVAAGAEEPEGKDVTEPVAVLTPAAPLPAAPPAAPLSAPPRFIGDSETVAMIPMRKAISEHMVLSKRTAAHVHTVFEVDMTSVVRVRDRHKDDFEKREGVKLTFTPFFVKALVDTVREFPILNASVSGDSVIFKKPVNVGIAVALENGLIVPVVKDAQLKSLTGLAVAIQDLAERARTKRLRPDDVQNGTISITNPGPYGSLFGTPIINQPQVAIMGIGGIEKRPVVVNDAIAIRSMVYLSLGFDHRVIDGAVADQFMARVKSRLESWTLWTD